VSVFPAESVNVMVAFRDQSQHKMVRTKERVPLPTKAKCKQTNKNLLLISLMQDSQLTEKKSKTQED